MKRPRSSYFICANPRSGSWLLAAGLEDTRLVGHPNEWFNIQEEKLRCGQWGIPRPISDYRAYIEQVLLAGSAGTDIFGVKCLAESFKDLIQKLSTIPNLKDLPAHASLAAVFPDIHYVRLIRRDLTRQSISYYRAARSEVWFSMEGVTDPPAKSVGYDPEEISRHEHMLLDLEGVWDKFFNEAGIKPLTVYYEDLAVNYIETIKVVLEYLGIDGNIAYSLPKSRFKKQADETTEQWVKLYNAYKGK